MPRCGGVIVSYRDGRSADFAAGNRVKALSGIERSARRKLDRLEAAHTIKDLAALPGNRFEALKGGRKGQYLRDRRTWRLWITTRENVWHPSQFTQGSTWPKNLTP